MEGVWIRVSVHRAGPWFSVSPNTYQYRPQCLYACSDAVLRMRSGDQARQAREVSLCLPRHVYRCAAYQSHPRGRLRYGTYGGTHAFLCISSDEQSKKRFLLGGVAFSCDEKGILLAPIRCRYTSVPMVEGM